MRTRLPALLLFLAATACATAELVVHEWGTFTSLQDEDGRAIGGINTDDEPVPSFVHNIAGNLLIPPTEVPPTFFQGAPAAHPQVTMRLETPVIYFHCPPGESPTVDVSVEFRGGWLTQYFPDAEAHAPGVEPHSVKFGPLTSDTTGTLVWRGLKVNAPGAGPETTDHVWLAPRNVEAQTLRTPAGEVEKFLFYRGVSHVEAPLTVCRESGDLIVGTALSGIRQLWLVDIRRGGSAAFRNLQRTEAAPLRTPATFQESEYSADAVQSLRSSLHAALVADGLFPDEANALLDTWKLSYFESTGLRLFFLVPRAWTDRQMPLKISGDPPTVRTMVGRIEIITPEQRELLERIAAGPVPDPWEDLRKPTDAATWETGDQKAFDDLFFGRRTFASLGIKVPETYRRYLDLGRFRNALVLDELARRPTPQLAEFIRTFRLEGYKLPE